MNKHRPSASKRLFLNTGTAAYALQYGLQPADRIKAPIFQTGLSKHHAIYLGVDQYGQEWISENHDVFGVRLVKADDFFKQTRSYTVEKFEGNYTHRVSAVKRALSELGKPYDLINYNCEHYASYVQSGKRESRQVANAAGLALGVILIAALFSAD